VVKVNKVFQFLKEARGEFRKITWPDKDEVTSFTGVVLVTVAIVSIFLWLVDSSLDALIRTVIK
jgi:preprotein translocase subunit SecE